MAIYTCAKCNNKAKIVRHDATVKGFICDDCYFDRPKKDKKYKK